MKNALKRTLSVMLVFMMVISCFTGMNVFAANDDKQSSSVSDTDKTSGSDKTSDSDKVTNSDKTSDSDKISDSDKKPESGKTSGTDVSGSDVSGSDVSGSDVSGSDVSGSDVSDSDVSGSDVSDSDVHEITAIEVDSGNEDKDVVICLGDTFEAVAKGKNIYNKIALFAGDKIIGQPVLVGSEKDKLSAVDIKSGTFVLPANATDKDIEYVFRAYAADTADKDVTASAGEKVGVVYVAKKTDTVDVKPEVVSFSDKGGTAELAVRTNANVSVSIENSGWISLVQKSKDGAVIIEVTAKENAGLARECAIVFKTTGTVPYIVKVKVLQDGVKGVDRLAGDDRIATAVAISKEGWEKAETVILASGVNYADALAGAPLSAAADAPILLTLNKNTGVEKAVLDEIARLGAKKVYILGGTVAISSEIESAVSAAGCSVTRLAGDTRYGTAVKVAEELAKVTGKQFTRLYFASGVNFPDALSVSSVAAIEGNPILYMPAKGDVDSETSKFITDGKHKNGVILGGTVAVSAEGQTSLTKLGLSVERVCGDDRYATSAAINKKYDALFAGKLIAVATGENFPDALAGGALCAKLKMPVVLVNSKSADSALEYIKGEAPESIVIFGGPNAVSDAVAVKLAAGVKQIAADTEKK